MTELQPGARVEIISQWSNFFGQRGNIVAIDMLHPSMPYFVTIDGYFKSYGNPVSFGKDEVKLVEEDENASR